MRQLESLTQMTTAVAWSIDVFVSRDTLTQACSHVLCSVRACIFERSIGTMPKRPSARWDLAVIFTIRATAETRTIMMMMMIHLVDGWCKNKTRTGSRVHRTCANDGRAMPKTCTRSCMAAADASSEPEARKRGPEVKTSRNSAVRWSPEPSDV